MSWRGVVPLPARHRRPGDQARRRGRGDRVAIGADRVAENGRPIRIKVFTETAGSALVERESLKEALAYVRPGDTLVVWRLDRLGRSLQHLIETVADLRDRGIGFKSLTEQIDTTTPAPWPNSSATSSANGPTPGWRRRGRGAGSAVGRRP
jgi:hypothetical protein